MQKKIVAIIGPTASGKTSRAIAEAKARGGEIISMDSRQVYRGLDIGTEKITIKEMQGIPHHLIDIRNPEESYSAGDFVQDATQLIDSITARKKVPILAGGTHFYIDALLYGLPRNTPENHALRETLEQHTNEDLLKRIEAVDPRRAKELDPHNRRRLIRALEIIETNDTVPSRTQKEPAYEVEWIVVDQPAEVLRERIDARLRQAFERDLIDEVRRVRETVGDERLNELGLEYRIVGEYLRGERDEATLFPALSAKLWQYARRQKAWLRKLGQIR